MIRTMLVPLDGSAYGEFALSYAANIARRTGATIHLVHVHVPDPPIVTDGVPLYDTGRDEELRQSEYHYLEQIGLRMLPNATYRYTTALLEGPVADALCAYIGQHAIDLTVMATHGRGALSRFWLGSVADRCVRECHGPILLIRPREPAVERPQTRDFHNVLIALDGSPLAEQIIPQALALGDETTTYHLLNVISMPIGVGYGMVYDASIDEQVIVQWQAAMQSYLDDAARKLFPATAQVRKTVLFGLAATSILSYIEDNQIDMVALATHGRGGLSRAVLGSVTDKVLRGATVPVLTFRPSETAHPEQ